MSAESALSDTTAASAWPSLDMRERRVLGVLVEKAKTTPDVYPLSLNSLVVGCNQKSNRDPLLNLSTDEVEETLIRLQKKGLTIRITGGRVERWRHALYEAWKVDKREVAVLAELLLRGPQTEGELRVRASRMEAIDDLDMLREVLRPLLERRLVVYLTPAERRGSVLTHGFHAPDELERLRTRHNAQGWEETSGENPPSAATAPPSASTAEQEAHWQAVQDELAALRSLVLELQTQQAKLAEQLRFLQQSLGISQEG